ncbi:MAG: radical SAM protein [Clostridia bacterium]|nr:radical SAM protein [Clostridia bacterium]
MALFVPHIGCPHTCSFCNQHAITGCKILPGAADVDAAVLTAMQSPSSCPEKTEIAFFGGSFTAVEETYRLSLLKCAQKWVKNGTVRGIRISTRPDAISTDILSQLKEYGVTSIELGAQSMDDEVLRLNQRGHTVEDVIASAEMIHAMDFSLGLQMMTGLYGDNDMKAVKTAEKIIALNPDQVRIYPTIVLKNTALATLFSDGKYRPQTVEEAVSLGAVLLKMFSEHQIPVIRFGLHTIPQDQYLAGPWHPALRELCEAELFYRLILSQMIYPGDYVVFVASNAVSKAIGQHRKNLFRWKESGRDCHIVADRSLKEYEIIVKETKKVN